jgi:hypothetical protein
MGTTGQEFSVVRGWRIRAQDPELRRAGLGPTSKYTRPKRNQQRKPDGSPVVPGRSQFICSNSSSTLGLMAPIQPDTC